jgi:hypothetical protein
MIFKDKLVAREGIEPPTRGFSVFDGEIPKNSGGF